MNGFFTEKFVNMCFAKSIMLWKLTRKTTAQIEARISVADFKKLHKIAHKTRCKVEIKNKKGLPFLLNKYKKRKIFAITFLVIAILIFGLTRFVWNIEINCDEEIDKANILEMLEENGIKEGVLISKLNTDKAINKICLESKDISWVGIKVSGTNVIVSIEMATEKPDIIDEDEVCDIISDKDAVITKITVLNGTAVVNEGDTVKTGDTLVRGIIQGKYTEERKVHSEALIYAKVWYTKVSEENLKQSYYEPTGNTYNNFGIKFNNFKINFNKSLPNFEKYDTIIANNKLKLFSNYYFPIQFEKISYTEMVLKYKEYTTEELSEKLQQKLKKEVLEENNILEKDLIDCIVSVNATEETVRVKLTCIVEEQIGKADSN